PEETDHVQVIVNLDSDSSDNTLPSDDDDDEEAALAALWVDKKGDLGEDAYEYQTTLKIYDSLGSTHDITIYFDKADTPYAYEFIVTCNPSEDNRAEDEDFADGCAGLLARGVIEFSSDSGDSSGSGVISNIKLWQIDPSNGSDVPQTVEDGHLSNGYFTFAPTFTESSMKVELDFGSRHDGSRWVNSSLSTTQFARASTTTFQSANGYGAGDLQGVNVDVDGIITGTYSNGQLVPLYRVALAKFQNVQGLSKEGGNLFRQTKESGAAITNKPGTNGLGSIAPNALEQSNVDIANEFVRMITTQRGFQANSKIITVTDQMLSELINLKR
ncbi:MAG: flagellar biosynthesis protein FlgE, partial [Deltaproteobacteria bacterium]